LTVRKILSVPFESARKLGFITTNPVAAVDEIKDKEKARARGRESFSHDELCSLLVAAGESEWQGLILLAVTTGLRLGDASKLTWECIDFDRQVLTVVTQETDTEVVIPIHPDFLQWLEMQRSGIGEAPVFPELSAKPVGGRPGLSAGFKLLMERAGIKAKAFVRKGEGRTTFSKGFHSFRHTYISSLANAGGAPDIRHKLAGHSDAKTHAQYTHHELQTLRNAIETIPRISVQT
jgi:integrase